MEQVQHLAAVAYVSRLSVILRKEHQELCYKHFCAHLQPRDDPTFIPKSLESKQQTFAIEELAAPKQLLLSVTRLNLASCGFVFFPQKLKGFHVVTTEEVQSLRWPLMLILNRTF